MFRSLIPLALIISPIVVDIFVLSIYERPSFLNRRFDLYNQFSINRLFRLLKNIVDNKLTSNKVILSDLLPLIFCAP